MKYIQIYKNKKVIHLGLQIKTIGGETIVLSSEEMVIYNCFSTATDIKDVFTKIYGDLSSNEHCIEPFNSLLVDWIQLSILKAV